MTATSAPASAPDAPGSSRKRTPRSRLKPLRNIWLRLRERLRASLWLVPALAALLALSGAKGLVLLDRVIGTEQAWFLFAGQPDSGRELLSAITSSMMTFTGLVFSITILVLQLASGQFSPRVVRTFLEDKVTQMAMAAFVGTFVFAMALLPEVRSETASQPAFVPALSIFIAFTLVLISVGVFIHYIDHMGHSIRAVSIIKRVAAETRSTLEHMHPGALGEADEGSVSRPQDEPVAACEHDGLPGVVASIDERALMDAACRSQLVLELVPMPGDFVPRGAPLFKIWGESNFDPDELRQAVLIEDERTPQQDPAFGFRQLVDIAERALSPGINDPTTAVQVLDELHDLLRSLVRKPFPSPLRVDAEGALRLILPRPGWDSYVHLALDEIRQYGAGSIQVARRMRAVIEDCLSIAPPDRRGALEEQRALLDAATARDIPSRAERDLARQPSAQGQGSRD